MPYAPPTIGPTGLIIPTYTDIRDYLVAQFLSIFGAACYLGTDSADYQDIAVRALQISDVNQSLQAAVLSFNPQTAIGASLDLIGKLIGAPRKGASNSTAVLTISGTAGTVITNGVARDVNGNLWMLPASVAIPGGGTIQVAAVAQQLGNITANPGDISIIATPTAGWTGAINVGAAVPGQAVEPDSQYRARLLISQAKPSLTLLAGTEAAVAAVEGVTRSVTYENYQNFTASYGYCSTSGTAVTILVGYPLDSSDAGQSITISGVPYTISSASGLSATLGSSAGTQTNVPFSVGPVGALGPAHSITCVAEGGAASDIAQAIYANRGIGCLTNGTTSVNVTDPRNPAITMPIAFDVLAYVPVYVSISVHALAGFTTATQNAIAAGIVAYLNSLGIGQGVVYSELYGAALTARPDPDVPLFSIRAVSSGALAAQTTGTLTLGSPTVTVASGTGIATGQAVTGAGVPAGTTVSGVSGVTVTLSANATANGTLVPLEFFTLASSDIAVSYQKAAQGATVNVLVNLV